jgi:hypothetical protein
MDLSLLRSVRTASLLIQKSGSEQYWDTSLPGLDPEHLKSAVHNCASNGHKPVKRFLNRV